MLVAQNMYWVEQWAAEIKIDIFQFPDFQEGRSAKYKKKYEVPSDTQKVFK
jgi:hypothetical protein